MKDVEQQVDRILIFLQAKIRGEGLTQLEVQEALGWGKSYISQLTTRQKRLRVDQVLQILRVLELDPAQFWTEVYGPSTRDAGRTDTASGDGQVAPSAAQSAAAASALIVRLTRLLVDKGILTEDELDEAMAGG